MRKLERHEERILTAMRRGGKAYFPNKDATDEPFILDTLNGLVRKKYLTVAMTDDGPAFSMTAYGYMVTDGA